MNPRDDERGARIVAGGNRFAFVAAVRTRALEIADGAPPRVFTSSAKPVTIAIQEAARGRMVSASAPPRRSSVVRPAGAAPHWVIQCRDCGKTVSVRRKAGTQVQGRPPTRCELCGISPNWEQIVT